MKTTEDISMTGSLSTNEHLLDIVQRGYSDWETHLRTIDAPQYSPSGAHVYSDKFSPVAVVSVPIYGRLL